MNIVSILVLWAFINNETQIYFVLTFGKNYLSTILYYISDIKSDGAKRRSLSVPQAAEGFNGFILLATMIIIIIIKVAFVPGRNFLPFGTIGNVFAVYYLYIYTYLFIFISFIVATKHRTTAAVLMCKSRRVKIRVHDDDMQCPERCHSG